MKLTINRVAELIYSDINRSILPLMVFKISSVKELNEFLFINRKIYTIIEYSYILYVLFDLPVYIPFFNKIYKISDYLKFNISMTVVLEHIFYGEITTGLCIRLLINKLNLKEDVDYAIMYRNNKRYHYINMITVLKCLTLSRHKKVIERMYDYYNDYLNLLDEYSENYIYNSRIVIYNLLINSKHKIVS